MSTHGRAHGISLPLCYFLQTIEKEAPEIASQKLCDEVRNLQLQKDVQVVVLIDHGVAVSLEPVSDFGKIVLDELQSRCEFTPCPEGECVFNGVACKWCGAFRVT